MKAFKIKFAYSMTGADETFTDSRVVVAGSDAQSAVDHVRKSLINLPIDNTDPESPVVISWELRGVEFVTEVEEIMIDQILAEAQRQGVQIEEQTPEQQ
jgi:hypothetical protein